MENPPWLLQVPLHSIAMEAAEPRTKLTREDPEPDSKPKKMLGAIWCMGCFVCMFNQFAMWKAKLCFFCMSLSLSCYILFCRSFMFFQYHGWAESFESEKLSLVWKQRTQMVWRYVTGHWHSLFAPCQLLFPQSPARRNPKVQWKIILLGFTSFSEAWLFQASCTFSL